MPITIDEPEVKRMYIGTRFADKVEKGAQNLMIGAAHRVQEMAKDQPGLLDDAIRLVGGGIKNVKNWSKDQEGIHDDMLRLAGGGIKNTLKIAGLAGEAGGWAGGKIAGAVGVDPRIGRTVGGVLGDAIPIAGVASKLKIASKLKNLHAVRTVKGLNRIASPRLYGGLPIGPGLDDAGKAAKNVFPKPNPFPEDKTLSRLYDKVEKGFKPKPGKKVYKGDNFTGDARKLRKQGKSATEVSEELGVKVRKVDGIDDVQKLRGSQKAGDPLAMKAESALESTSTDIRRRITEVKQTPKGQAGFGADSKAVKALEKTYGGKVNKHHGVGLQQIDFLYDDASPKDMKELTRYIFEELNEPIGSIAANRMTIHDAKVHRPLHNWLRKEVIGLEKTGDPTNIQIDLKRFFGVKNLKKLPIETRKKAAQIYFEHIAPASKEQLFALQQQFIKGK